MQKIEIPNSQENNEEKKEQSNKQENEKFELIIDQSKEGEKLLEKKCYELKELAEKIHKANEQKAIKNKIKDKEIDDLNDQIHNIMLTNYDLEVAITKELQLRNSYEYEQRKIAAYCNDLRAKFENMEKTINDYENAISNLKQENKEIAEAYEKKIDEIDNENKKTVKKIDDRIDLYNKQKREILENENKIENLLKEIEQQKNTFNERAMVNKIKYEELEKKYNNLQKKVYELQMNTDIKKTEKIKKRQKEKEKEKNNEMEKIEQKIKDYEENNEKLMGQINELTKQYKDMSRSDAFSNKDYMSSRGKSSKSTRFTNTYRGSNNVPNKFNKNNQGGENGMKTTKSLYLV
jgi:DNA repair exonuclease SbcCD ATPase subunit